MSYRSVKRVLGETNLERKCRVLFGVCLLLLISGAFFWVDRVAENLILDTNRSKGRDLVDILLFRVHVKPFFSTAEGQHSAFTDDLNEGLSKNKDYDYDILVTDTKGSLVDIGARTPVGSEIERVQHLERLLAERNAASSEESDELAEEREVDELHQAVAFTDESWSSLGVYNYYEPIQFSVSCKQCHYPPSDTGALAKSEFDAAEVAGPSLHVIKVKIPYSETKAAINQTRAVLITVAIVTVFLSMVALYIIVRYVIVKPLQHLRSVSDDVSRGKTELRAELKTGDEFEDLADSFNRMLRHLTDAQEELWEVNRDLDGKVDELARLNLQLHEMNQLKSEFLANMSHELRTPLNSIIGFSEVLQSIKSLDDKQKRYAANIQKSGRLLLEMINDILDLAKVEAGQMEIRPTEFSLDSFVQAHCELIRSLTDEKNIDLEVQVQHNLPPIYQDQVKIQQILTNLLSNAIKFTPEGGRITVVGRRDERGRLELSVSDTGVGIAAEDREVIFEKFRQGPVMTGANNLTREFSGTGLGLSIVKELCKLLDGTVSLESELGKGSTFRIVLPWTAANQPEREARLTSKFDELTSPKRIDYGRAQESPTPPVEVGAAAEANAEAET